MNDTANDPLAMFRAVNVDGTMALARQAAERGVKTFVFVSSIKVNGEEPADGRIYTADDVPQPTDPYGISKWEAENALRALGAETGMAIVIIRPPLVYGPGVKANFASMVQWVQKGIPLPLGDASNRRSLIFVGNLTDLIITAAQDKAAANQIFLASDGTDLSVAELFKAIAKACNRPSRLIPVPAFLMRLALICLGKRQIARRLFSSLQVDIEKTRTRLGWTPPFTVAEGLRKTVEGLDV
jgi:UDP-glucose 4-epimerase